MLKNINNKKMEEFIMDKDCIKCAHWSVQRIMEDYKKKPGDFEKLFFDMNSQREEGQWNSVWKSDLIHSLMQGYHVPPIHIAKTGTKNIKPMSVFEGKQRITSIREYVLGLFRLGKDTMPVTFKSEMVDEKGKYIYDENGRRIVKEEECQVAGKYFRELPEKLQKLLLYSEITLNMYFDLTDEEIAIQMERLNRQKKFNGTQTAKVKIGELKASYINDITKNEFFDNRILLTPAKKKSDELSKIVFQSLMIYTGNVTTLNNGNIEKFVKNHPEQFDKPILDKINDILVDLDKLIPDNEKVNKFLNSINIPILVFNYDKYEQMLENEEITREEYKKFLKYWFDKGILSEEYNQYVENTPTNKTFVEGRINVMEEELVNFVVNIHNQEDKENTDYENIIAENTVENISKEDTLKENVAENISKKDTLEENAAENISKKDTLEENIAENDRSVDSVINDENEISEKNDIKEEKNVDISEDKNSKTNIEEKNTILNDYLKSTAENLPEKIALKVLKSVIEVSGYTIKDITNAEKLIDYMYTFSDNQQRNFIEESIELISKIDFKDVNEAIVTHIIKVYKNIKSNDEESENYIKFNKWVHSLSKDNKYKELMIEWNNSEENQETEYNYLCDSFMNFSIMNENPANECYIHD